MQAQQQPSAAQIFLSNCAKEMNMGAFLLGISNSKAAQGGNLAYIDIRLNGQRLLIKHAFSNSSSMPQAVKADFAPSVPNASLGTVGIPNGSQHANHTEPKLLEYVKGNFHLLNGGFDEVILASQLDCCGSCVKHTISAITAAVAMSNMDTTTTQIRFTVVEINSGRIRRGDQF